MAKFEQWEGFQGKNWVNSVDVRDFIQCNYTPYDGDETFLEGPTEAERGTCKRRRSGYGNRSSFRYHSIWPGIYR